MQDGIPPKFIYSNQLFTFLISCCVFHFPAKKFWRNGLSYRRILVVKFPLTAFI